jgi:deoxyribonuclease-4
MFYIGCHLSISGGYENMGKVALSIGANTFQFFTRNPRSSRVRNTNIDDITALARLITENGFAPLIAHAPYTYNPAAAKEDIREFTATAMREDVELLENIPGTLYNFHPGCHVGQGSDVGIRLCSDVLNKVITPGQSTTVLIETMAGKGSEIGCTFEEVRAIIDGVEPSKQPHVGVCLDTCHVSDGGYDIAGETESVLAEFDRIVGRDRLKGIHLNDSKNPVGAHKDRHEKIGEGFLTLEGITNIINSPRLEGLPFCLETPNEVDGYAAEIKLLKEAYRGK